MNSPVVEHAEQVYREEDYDARQLDGQEGTPTVLEDARELIESNDGVGGDGIIEGRFLIYSGSDDQDEGEKGEGVEDEVALEHGVDVRIVSGQAGHGANGVIIFDGSSEATSARRPSRTAENDAQAIDDGVIGEIARHNVEVVSKLSAEKVEESVGMNESVRHGFLFLLERSKHPVPDDEHAGKVLVEVLGIASVVNSVV